MYSSYFENRKGGGREREDARNSVNEWNQHVNDGVQWQTFGLHELDKPSNL